MNSQKLSSLILYVIDAHDKFAKREQDRFRKWDGKTPYSIHPIWCAMTLLSETSLPESVRDFGAEALLLHDIQEDTNAPIFECSDEAKKLSRELTFDKSEDSMQLIFERSKTAQLLKLYDKISNFLDGSWMSGEKKQKSLLDIERLSKEVISNFGPLNITKIASSLLKDN